MFPFPPGTDTVDKALAIIRQTYQRDGVDLDKPVNADYSNGLIRIYENAAQWQWAQDCRPFFRLWPGFLEAVRTLRIPDIKLSDLMIDFPDNIQSICLEMPVENSPMFGSEYMTTILIGKVSPSFIKKASEQYTYFITMYLTDTSKSGDSRHMSSHFRFCIDEVTQDTTIGEYLEAGGIFNNAENADNSLRYFAVSIAILVGLITKTQSDTPLIEPVVIRKFQEKWEATRDISFIERSKNRGLYGWDVGKNLPDKEQIAEMRDEAIKGDTKSPHWRNPHFSRRIVGKKEEGRKEWRFVSGAFIHKDGMLSVPQGYYGDS